jgi:hypothetical protein
MGNRVHGDDYGCAGVDSEGIMEARRERYKADKRIDGGRNSHARTLLEIGEELAALEGCLDRLPTGRRDPTRAVGSRYRGTKKN